MNTVMKRFYVLGALFVLLVGLGLFVQYRISSETMMDQTKEQLQLKGQQAALEIEGWIALQSAVINNTKAALKVMESEKDMLLLLEEQLRKNEYFFSIYFGTPDNHMLNASGWEPPEGFDLRRRPWYIGAIESEDLYYSNAFLNATEDEYIITISVTVLDELGEIKGVLSGDITLDETITAVNHYEVSENGQAFLLDHQGEILCPSENLLRETCVRASLVERFSADLLEKEEGFLDVEFEEVKGLAAYRKISDTGWTLISFVPEQDYIGVIRRSNAIFFGILLLTLSAMTAGFYQQKKDVMDPLVVLGRDIESISLEERIDYRLPENKNDTFNLTRKRLNRILNQSQEYFEDLQANEEELIAANEELSTYIQQLKIAEKTLRNEKERAEKAVLVKDQFLANMSHELRTPLNGLMGMLQLLQFSELSEEQRENIEMGLCSCESMNDVVTDILNYISLQQKDHSREERRFRLEELFVEVLETVQVEAFKKELTVTYDIDQALPNSFFGDRYRLKKVLMNLVKNAVKFTEEGGVLVEVDKRPLKDLHKGYESMVFRVQDTGIGIDSSMHDRIFEAFNQADNSRTRSYEGIGLGLATVKELVSQMGGEISLSSEIGKGSTFEVSFTMRTDEV